MHPILYIRDFDLFNTEWPKKTNNTTFLVRWRDIIEYQHQNWIINYLITYDSYIEPWVEFSNLSKLEFSLPNFHKSSREKRAWVLTPQSMVTDLEEVEDLIMIYWKIEEES